MPDTFKETGIMDHKHEDYKDEGHHTDVKRTERHKTIRSHDHELDENSKEKLDDRLDQAGEESFPGSDPVSVKITK
jgi:hypothetical protein